MNTTKNIFSNTKRVVSKLMSSVTQKRFGRKVPPLFYHAPYQVLIILIVETNTKIFHASTHQITRSSGISSDCVGGDVRWAFSPIEVAKAVGVGVDGQFHRRG